MLLKPQKHCLEIHVRCGCQLLPRFTRMQAPREYSLLDPSVTIIYPSDLISPPTSSMVRSCCFGSWTRNTGSSKLKTVGVPRSSSFHHKPLSCVLFSQIMFLLSLGSLLPAAPLHTEYHRPRPPSPCAPSTSQEPPPIVLPAILEYWRLLDFILVTHWRLIRQLPLL